MRIQIHCACAHMCARNNHVCINSYTTRYGKYAEDQTRSKSGTIELAHFFRHSKSVFSLPIGFSVNLEGSVIEMKPAALSLEDRTVILKALA